MIPEPVLAGGIIFCYDADMHELFEHTADLGLRIQTPDLPSLFAEAALCLYSAIIDNPESIQATTTQTVEIAGREQDLLLFDWLRELLYRFETEHRLVARAEVVMHEEGLNATIWGEPFDSTRHIPAHEVKAITYHELQVEQNAAGWRAEVIVDI
ncbi:MAG: archease [Bacteroidales bacterium]|nr:archease [Bacteroidales bacterium]